MKTLLAAFLMTAILSLSAPVVKANWASDKATQVVEAVKEIGSWVNKIFNYVKNHPGQVAAVTVVVGTSAFLFIAPVPAGLAKLGTAVGGKAWCMLGTICVFA